MKCVLSKLHCHMYTKQNITLTQFQTKPTGHHSLLLHNTQISFQLFPTYKYSGLLQLISLYSNRFVVILVTSPCKAIMYLTLYMKIVTLYASFFLHLEE